jgi:hypothetical protein
MAVEFEHSQELQQKSYVRRLMKERIERDIVRLSSVKRQVNGRISVYHSVALDAMAEMFGVARSALAAELLEAAIRDAAEMVGIDIASEEFRKQFGDRLDAEAVRAAAEDEQ